MRTAKAGYVPAKSELSYLLFECRFVTIFQLTAFLGALGSGILSIIHFTNQGSVVDGSEFVAGIVIALSVPVVHYLIEVYSMIRNDRY